MQHIPILHIEQFEKEESLSDFYSNDLQLHLKKNAQIIHKPHKHDFFLCVLFCKGSGVHEIDFNAYPIQPGSVFFLKPGQTHSWNFNSTPEGYIFFHTPDFYELYFLNRKLTQFPFYYSLKNPPDLTLVPEAISNVAARFKEINTEYQQSFTYKKQKLSSLVNLTYIDLTRHYANYEPIKKVLSSTYLQTLEILENLIEQFYKTEKSAKFYADKLHITPKHLNRITKSTLNKTTTELITERVLLESKRLIVHSGNSLIQVAETLGYEDYAYFSRVFKLKTGKTPLEFKKSYQ
ncbi:AraC family transcriptional regulator [Flagellimonas aquimarina]|uniref:AraC family transcriptional regulator n=1 Tax=Flagellimonas aquimarina TaxID=2201895 RepID=A0A316L0R7_9FLAO|nr:helix-turn-helix domain-containing protein [Allomuricauda koreensis]PWL38908.1 AraC family transcriptional regulator [Allomuricauda koreensis]